MTTTTTHPNTEEKQDNDSSSRSSLIRVSCAVERADWDACLAYAARSPNHVAALGIHPWYLEGLLVTTTTDDNNEEEREDSDGSGCTNSKNGCGSIRACWWERLACASRPAF